ncbi:MAG: EF-hand domain-containing protein [Gammaproteobacteria bacterium]|nr:EF-hand domain-containing protein [Gammaproteobacteria bacterium]
MNKFRFVSIVIVAFSFASTANSNETTGADNSAANNKDSSDPIVVDEFNLPDLKSSETVEAMGSLLQSFSNLAFETLDDVFSEDSVSAALEEAWTKQVEEFDADENGGLSREEVVAIPDFRLDDEGNVLSDEEFAALVDETFENLDSDNDGEITKKETQEYMMAEIVKAQEVIDSAVEEFNLNLAPLEDSNESSSDVDTGKLKQ